MPVGQASRLPMRNWNVEFLVFLLSRQFGFQTTYEELKPGNTVRYCRMFWRLPDYLWGIETQTLRSITPVYACASRLPMRNWNQSFQQRRPTQSRFQTTYEELKPGNTFRYCRMFWRLPDYLWGIETCAARIAVGNLRTGFQTTYEELKLIYPCLFRARLSASRLPMRNWNFWRF